VAFDDFELSVSDSAPVELYTFVDPTATWRLTTHHKDITFGGNTYTATVGSRSSLSVVGLADDSYDLTVELEAAHALVQKYANGVAPYSVTCLVQRYQPASGLAIQLWSGPVTSLAFKGRMGSFRISSGIADALAQECPNVTAQRSCGHQLYDARCTKLESSFAVATGIDAISADGRTITTLGSVPAAIGGVPWALHGTLLHVPSNERRTIIVQPSTTQFQIQLEFPLGLVSVGDAVKVIAGCNLTLEQCKAKFSNVINFGGMPSLPQSNLFYVGAVAMRYQ
jgi:uncharacterized phage protein (TIGR02218 family)